MAREALLHGVVRGFRVIQQMGGVANQPTPVDAHELSERGAISEHDATHQRQVGGVSVCCLGPLGP